MAPFYLNFKEVFRKATPPLLIVVCVVLIALGQIKPIVSDKARMFVSDCFAPIWQVLARTQGFVSTFLHEATDIDHTLEENRQLKKDNDQLHQWYETSLKLMRENALLKEQLHYLPQHYTSYVTGPIIADTGGGYTRALIIEGGRNNGIETGNLALSSQGLAGRVLQVGEHTARILLVTDSTSRIPVYLLSSHKEAIMAGNNSPTPQLLYYSKESPPQEGEIIETDNQPGIPSGITIGRVHYEGTPSTPHIYLFTPLERLKVLRIFQFAQPAPLPKDNSTPSKKTQRK